MFYHVPGEKGASLWLPIDDCYMAGHCHPPQLSATVAHCFTAHCFTSLPHRTPTTTTIKWRIFIYTTAQPFWFAAQDASFDARVFHPNVPSNSSRTIKAAYKKHEDENKRAYGQRVRDNEQGVFTPLVFSTTGGLGQEATTFYKRLADMLAWK